jgi:hypothetical protein
LIRIDNENHPKVRGLRIQMVTPAGPRIVADGLDPDLAAGTVTVPRLILKRLRQPFAGFGLARCVGAAASGSSGQG